MSLVLDDPDTDRLARELAEAMGETTEQAVKAALRERLSRARKVDEAERQRRYNAIMDFAKRWRAAPVVDPRPIDEILGYDENGLPT